MQSDTSPILEELEEQVKSQTIQQHSEVLDNLENLLNSYLKGFGQLGTFTLTDENQKEQVWLYLVSRAFNSLRWAFNLLQRGYYSQALTLTRSAYEDWLVCMDCRNNPETVEAILSAESYMPKFKAMSKRLEEPLRRGWDGDYGFLSTFAHPRHRAITVIVNPEFKNLRVGPDYDETMFMITSYYLGTAGLRLGMFLVLLTDLKSPEWAKEVFLPVLENTEACLERIYEESKRLLESVT